MKNLFVLSVLLLLCGCAGVPSTKVILPGGYSLVSPKNVNVEGLKITLPNGTKIEIQKLTSTNDASVMMQSVQGQKEIITATGDVLSKNTKTTIEAIKTSQGIPQ